MYIEKVCAIIVTFNPDLPITKKLVSSISKQVERVIVVDNNSEEKILGEIDSFSICFGCEVIKLNENVGLASAQNIGLKRALENEFEFVVLFDQDSVPEEKMITKLLKNFRNLMRDGHLVGCVGPRFVDSRNNFEYNTLENIKTNENVPFLIASGSLISIDAIKKVGYMREDLFIYHIDREWCFRAIDKGYKLFVIKEAVMLHTVGENVIKIWLGKWKNISIHTPLSHYYVIRNSLLLMNVEYIPMSWKLKRIFKNIFMVLFFSTVTSPRRKHFTYMVKGFIDGIRKKSGKY